MAYEDNRKWLYDQMKGKVDIPSTYEEFSSDMDMDDRRDWYYQQSKDAGIDVGPEDEFRTAMATPKDSQPATAHAVMTQQPMQDAMPQATAEPQPVQEPQPMMNTSQLDQKYQLNEDGSVKPFNVLETERTLDEQGNTVNKPKLVKGADGTDVYRNAMTGEEYNPLSPEGMEMAGQNTIIVPTDLKKANREQVANLSADIDNAFSEYQKKRPTAISYGTYYGGAAGVTNTQDKEFQTLTAAKQSVYDAQKMIEAADANAKNGTIGEWLNSSFVGGATRGFGDKFFDVRTWDMGLSDAVNNKTLYEALQKADSGQELTKSEQMLLDAKSVEMATNAYFGSYLGRGYQAGAVTAESLPFMLEMTINPASTAGNTAQSMLARYAMKRLGNKAAAKAIGVAGRAVGDLAGAATMAATTGTGRVTADAFDRMNNGEEDWGTAIAKAYGGTVIENYSEMVGEYFAPVLGVAGNGLSKGMDKIGLGAVNDFIENVSSSRLAQLVSDFENSAKWSGLFSEYAEEVTGNIMNALTVGDMTLDTAEGTGVFNLDQNIDTFLGTALMGGALSGIKTLGYRTPKYSARKAMTGADDSAAALFADPAEWGNIRNTIAFGTDEDAKEMLADVLGSDAFSTEQKAAVMNYASKAEAYKGVMMAEQKRRGENSGSDEVDVETSYDNGQSLETPQEKNDARNMYDMQRERVSEFFSEPMVDWFDENPMTALSTVHSGDWSDDAKQAALDYVNAKATYDGMIDKVRDDIDSQVTASDASIDSRTNHTLGDGFGKILPATMKMNDRQVYVIDGDIQMMDDGSMVDVSKSSESILVRDAETGKLEFVSPHDVLNLGQAVSAEQEKATAREAITQQVAQEQTAIIEGVLPFNAGDIYELADDQGVMQATVVQDNGDGTVLITMNGQNMTMPRYLIQQMSDAANMKRLADYQQQKNGAADNTPAADAAGTVAGPQQRNYALNDEVVLRDADGNGVRGTIVSEPDADGLYEVETAMPINGKRVNQWSADEIGAMLMEHNGEAVTQPAADAAGTVAGVQNTGENVINGGENVINGGENVQQTSESVQNEPMPMVGEGENAEPDFMATTPERGFAYLFGESGLEESDAAAFLNNNVTASAKDVEKIKGKKPKMGTSIAKFNKDTAEWQNKLNDAEAKAEYWKQMKALRDGVVAEQKAEAKAEAKAQQDAAIDKARAEEEAYAKEQAKKAAEQAELGSNNVSQAIREKWAAAHKTEGVADEIVLANGEKVAGKYYLVESGAASPSHDANNGFVKTEGFPVDENGNSVNDRDYERDQDAQRVTRQIADNYDSRALQTPVVVSQDGVVLSGNGRTMAGELAASNNTDGAYVDYLKNYGQRWGFTGEQVSGIQHPRVVFVPDVSLPYTAETFAKFNQQEMKGQSKTEQAVKLGKVVDDATFGRIITSINRFERLSDFYADAKAATEAIGELQKAGAISQAQVAEMFDGDGISAIGRELLENMLVGKAFENNPDAVREITAFRSVRQTVIKALGEILNNVKLGEDYSLEEELAGAIDLVYKARKEGKYKEGERVSGFARQMNLGLYGDDMTVADMNNVTMLEIADILNSGFESRLKVYMQQYNTHAQESAAGQLDLFSGDVMSKEDILNDVNNLFNNGTEQETADTRAEGVAEDGAVNNGGEGSTQEVRYDNQGNPVDKYGNLVVERVSEISEITDNDFTTPTRNIELPAIPKIVADAIGTNGKPVVIKKNIFEKNLRRHKDLSPEDGRKILSDVLYSPNLYGQNQKRTRPYNWILVHLAETNEAVILEVNDNKDNVEIVNWHYLRGEALRQKERQAINEGGRILTLGSAAGDAIDNSSFDREDSNKIANGQKETVKNAETPAVEAETESVDGNSSPVATAIAAAEAETDTNPSEAQKEAGNYKKGHVKVDGYDITIENPKGSVRSGKDADGKEWSVTMNNTYGYIRGTEGVDGDHIDVFLSDNPEHGNVYVVDQVDADGNFDEHKVMYGFGSADEARDNYLANYSEGWKMGVITEVSKEEFKKWIESSHRKTKPFSEYKSVKKEGAQGEAQKEPTPQEARNWLNAKYDGQSMPTDGSSHAIGWIDNLSDEDALVMYRAETLGSDPTKTEDDAFEVFQYFDDIADGLTPDESARPILEKYGKKFDNQQPSTAAETKEQYTITPTTYTTAKGKKLQMQLVTFTGLSNEQMRAAKKLSKDKKGWYSLDHKGFLMRTEEDAKWLADAVMGEDEDVVEDNQPASLADVQKAAEVAVVGPNLNSERNGFGEDEAVRVYGPKVSERTVTREDGATLTVSEYDAGTVMDMRNGDDRISQAFTKDGKPHGRPLFNLGVNGDMVKGMLDKRGRFAMTNEELLATFEKNAANDSASNGANEPLKNGDRVMYRNYEMEIVEIYPDGTVELKGNVMAMGLNPMGVKLSEVRRPGSNESIEFYRSQFEEEIKKKNYDKKFCEKVLKQVDGNIDNLKEKIDGETKASLQYVEGMARLLGMRQALVEKIEGKKAADQKQTPKAEKKAEDKKQEPSTAAVKEFHGGEQVWSKKHNENKHILMAHHVTMADGASFVQSYTFTDGTGATAMEVEAPHADQTQTEQEPKTEAKAGSGNKLVTDQRYAELQARLKAKLNRLNVGIDPEVLAIGTEMAVYHIEKGTRKFAEYAKAMIEDIGDAVRPYLKAFYNGVRDMPEVEQWADELTPYDEVRRFDMAGFDKTSVDAMATAEMVVNEQNLEKQAEEVKNNIVETRNNERHETERQTAAITEALASEAETVASEAEIVAESGDAAAINEQVSKIDDELEKVNAQLALLGYYEAETSDKSQEHESLGFMRTAEKKAVKDADKLAKAIASALGVDLGKKVVAKANIAPIGGDVTFRIPLKEDYEIFFDLMLDRGSEANAWRLKPGRDFTGDDLVFVRGMWRLEDPRQGHSWKGSNFFFDENAKTEDLIADVQSQVKRLVKDFEIKPLEEAKDTKEVKATTEKTVKKVNEKGTAKKKEVSLQADTLMGDLFADLMDGEVETTTTIVEKPKTKDGWLQSIHQTYKAWCAKLGLPEDPIFEKSYSHDYKATKGYRLDELEKYDESYRKKMEEAVVEPATEKQMAFINKLAEDNERQSLEGVTLTKQAASYIIEILKEAEAAVTNRYSTASDFEQLADEFDKVVELNKALPPFTAQPINNNDNEQQLERDRESVRTEGLPANANQQAEQTGGVRQEAGQASERADRGGEAGRTGELGGSVQSARGLDGQLKKQSEQAPLKPDERKNTNNNHAERGKDYAPKGVEARIDANIKAVEVMQELMENGQKATPQQMAVLRQYSGWGGLGKAFTDAAMSKRLRELLGDEAYEQANMSRNSAYYTPAAVIDAMWDVARAMGFKGGNVLEGSAGIGNIIGAMPMDMSDRSNIHAVEIDGTTGNILSLLYPDAHVEVQGFEATRIPNGSVDLAITNVPFVTGLRVMDTTGDKDLSKKFRDIHDFCIAKNIRKLRDGGIGIFISSSGTMDNSKKLRDWIVSEGNADVVGAFRLNNETFGGTGATSDIIVVRKRVNGVKSANAIDVSTTTAERSTEYDTGEAKKVKGQMQPVVKQLAMDYNRYFVEHPENMGGRMMFGFENNDTFRPTSRALYPEKGKNQSELLNKWVKGFEEMKPELTADETRNSIEHERLLDMEQTGAKIGSMLIDSKGRICVVEMAGARPLNLNDNKIKGKTKKQCFESYSAIKDALADVLKYQTENESDAELKPLLAKLNKAFDDFVKNFGHLHKNNQIAWLKNDVDWSSIMALETTKDKVDAYGKVTQEYGKTDIFKQRVVEKDKAPEPKNVKDGIIASIYQYGRVNVPYIAEKVGKTEAEVRDEIIESGLGFENPVNMQLEVSYEYLSGNVREKLQQAMDANEGGKYDANVKALEKVVPMDIPAHLIDFTLGSSWVDHKLYEDYVKDRTDIDVTLTNAGGTWIMKTPYYVNQEKNRSAGVYSEMLRKTVYGHQLIEAAIQNKSITVSETRKKWDGTTETTTDKEATQACATRIDEIRQDFKEWARQKMQTDSEMSAKMERIYNDQFNNFVPVSVPDEFVPEYFGGASHKFKMRPHQAKAIVRGTMQPVLLAHEVGTGKTFTLISTAMEMRRLGTARKPMVVVQNATVGQFVASAKALYPNAKVLTLEEKDHTGEGRKNFYAKIKYNDWDMIVVPQSVFERIPDSEERQMAFIEDKIQEKLVALEAMREADPDSWVTKAAEREIEQLEAERAQVGSVAADKRKSKDEKKEAVTRQNAEVKAREMLDRATDDVENFDDMGIDAILVDEAHEYKHLGFATAMQRGVKGVDPSYSKKAQGVYLKAQAVLEKNNGRNVIFATGTPISNTAAEIWTFMRYLMPSDTMKDYGIYYFDDFVRNFGNLQTMLEFTTSGKFKENNRFAGYVNLPELVRIWSSVSDTVLTREAGGVSDKIPEMETGKAQDIYLPQTRALRSVMKFVKAELNRYESMTGKEKKENSAIPLKMYGIAKAAAVDARLVLEDAEDDPNSKTNEAVRRTVEDLKKTAKYNGTVAIFADNYQNKHSGFNIYEDIREKLIKEGVPADQIVVMKSGMSVKKKLEIFDKVNRGDVRVIMGSTFTLGTGVNIQERLHMLIHLDAPNRPMDYTQRNGRILRQGNLHKDMGLTVSVLRFGVEDSLDVTAYQRLKTKGAIADSIMNGKQMMNNSMENRALEEEEDVFGDTVAQLSGSEYAMLKNQAEKDVRKYEAKRKQWEADQTYIHNAIPRLEEQIVTEQQKAADNRRYAKLIDEGFKGEKNPEITIGKQTFADLEAMGEYFKEYNKKLKEDETAMRESHMEEQRARKAEVKVGNFTFDVKTTLKAEVKQEGVMLVTTVRRKTTYSCDALGLEDVAASGGYLKNAIEEILEMAQVGGARRLNAAERSDETVERLKSELEQVKAREGKPFEYEKELEAAHEHYDEYSELMKKEMEEKEKKYADMDNEVEAATNVDSAEEAEEDSTEDSGVRYREEETATPMSTADDKDLRYSLREERAPKKTRKAYAVFVVKQHKDGTVSLHPKMLADEEVGAPPLTWLNADTGTIKRDKDGEPLQNTRGRVSVRDAKGAPLAWRPGKHLAEYPNASQFVSKKSGKIGSDVVFFEVEYAADRDYQLEAWEYGVNSNGKYEHSQAGLPYIPKDGFYKYRTNANPKIPAMIITGAYKINRALTDEEAKKLNVAAGGEWFDREGEPMTAERLKALGLDEAGLDEKAANFDYDKLEEPHDESAVAMSMPGYVRRDLNFDDPNLLKAIKENGQDADTYKYMYEKQRADERERQATEFADGHVLPITNDGFDYQIEGLTMPAYRSKKALLNAFQEKYAGYAAGLTADGNGIKVYAWHKMLAGMRKEDVKKRRNATTKAEQKKAAYVERKTRIAIDMVNAKAEKLGLNVEVKTDTEGLTGRRARAKGWYDTTNGKITIVLPNHTDGTDVMRTLMHEGVAHHGLRQMFGEDFDTFLDNVYANATEEIRKRIAEMAARKGWDFHVATEEYLAALAEDIDFERNVDQSWWHKVKFFFVDMLRKAGIVLGDKLTDNDLRYIVWKSYERMAYAGEYGAIRDARTEVMKQSLGVGNYAQTDTSADAHGTVAKQVADGSVLMYRDGDRMDQRDHAIVSGRYEREMQNSMYQFREAMQDSMLSLKKLMDYVAEATGEKVKDYENAYMAENALSSKNHAEQELYGKMLFNPMLDEVHRLAKEPGAAGSEPEGREGVTRYMMSKHGLERQKLMEARAYQAGEDSDRDFAGLTGLFETDDLADAIAQAEQLVADFESVHDVKELWARVNACTNRTLEKTYKSGLLSKDGYETISKMYEYYIPLRGFDATTSDQVYDYLTRERSSFNNPLKKAEGRSSVANDPLATIANMADSAIVQGNKNLMKQKFLKFVMNHPTDVASVNRMWLKKNDITDTWEAVTAQLDENDTPEEILQKTEAFEEQMEQLAQNDPDHYKRGKDAANIPFRTLGKDMDEHMVHVKMGGQNYIITINGNPRVAQALNGLTNPDNDSAGAIGAILKAGEYVNRQMSAFYTTRNPEFVLSNFLRDALYSNSTMWVRETPNYALKFNKNFIKYIPKQIYQLLQKHNTGTLDMNIPVEKAFYDFMTNGGETGYTVVKDIEKQKKLIKKYMGGKDAKIPVGKAWDMLGEKLDEVNRAVENCARFAAFLTSREMGRTVERSVMDAKEVSVNFNKKGAGSKFLGKQGQGKWYSLGNVGAMTSGVGRSFYVFWNAAVQGTTNFGRLHKHHTAKALAMDAGLFLLGAVLAGMGSDDDDEYYNLPSYVRRSNICFKMPFFDSYITIPLGIEQRAIYGLGELFSSVASGRERLSGLEIAKEIAAAMSSLMPVDMMEGNGELSGSALVPSYVKPIVEAAVNKDWKGMPIYKDTPWNKEDPEYTKSSKRTNKMLVDMAEALNEWTGGDDVKKGWVDINPAQVEHVLEGTFGGVSTMVNKLVKIGQMTTGQQDFDLRNIPMVSRVVKSTDTDAEARRINTEYYKYYNEYKETKRLVSHYEKQEDEGILGMAEKLDFMYNSPEYGRYEIVDEYYDQVKDLTDRLKETVETDERQMLEEEITDLKREMIEAVRAYDDARNNR